MKKMKCEECSGKAEFECPECGTRYCSECASNSDDECDCIEPPRLVNIKSYSKTRPAKGKR